MLFHISHLQLFWLCIARKAFEGQHTLHELRAELMQSMLAFERRSNKQ